MGNGSSNLGLEKMHVALCSFGLSSDYQTIKSADYTPCLEKTSQTKIVTWRRPFKWPFSIPPHLMSATLLLHFMGKPLQVK